VLKHGSRKQVIYSALAQQSRRIPIEDLDRRGFAAQIEIPTVERVAVETADPRQEISPGKEP